MATKYTLREGTAYPKNRIRAVLIEEVMRRLRNCSPEMSWEEKGKFLTEFSVEMKNSGHSEEFRKEIMKRAVTKYEKQLREHNSGKRCLYRNREEREKDKGDGNTRDSWFRKKKSDNHNQTTSILRVPYTRGVLKKKIQNSLNKIRRPEGTLTLAQEDSGDKLKHQLIQQDPFSEKKMWKNDMHSKNKK